MKLNSSIFKFAQFSKILFAIYHHRLQVFRLFLHLGITELIIYLLTIRFYCFSKLFKNHNLIGTLRISSNTLSLHRTFMCRSTGTEILLKECKVMLLLPYIVKYALLRISVPFFWICVCAFDIGIILLIIKI